MTDDDGPIPLDIVTILLSTIVRPVSVNFRSGPFPVADHQGHVLAVSVVQGKGVLISGSPIDPPPSAFDSEISTSDASCESHLQDLAALLKEATESVNDVTISNFTLQFGLRSGELPMLLGCEGSELTPSADLQPYVSSLQIISLFYAAETYVIPIPSECITRGRYCLTGSQTLERSKIVSIHIKRIVDTLGFDEEAFHYLKHRMTHLNPTLMMAHVPVCAECFKYYNMDHPGKRCGTATERTRLSATLGLPHSPEKVHRPKSALLVRRVDPNTTSSLPIIRARMPDYRIGSITPSGLRVATQMSTDQLEWAARMYRKPPFVRAPPPLPDPAWRYRPPSVNALN
jgi:hypothetical protein